MHHQFYWNFLSLHSAIPVMASSIGEVHPFFRYHFCMNVAAHYYIVSVHWLLLIDHFESIKKSKEFNDTEITIQVRFSFSSSIVVVQPAHALFSCLLVTALVLVMQSTGCLAISRMQVLPILQHSFQLSNRRYNFPLISKITSNQYNSSCILYHETTSILPVKNSKLFMKYHLIHNVHPW